MPFSENRRQAIVAKKKRFRYAKEQPFNFAAAVESRARPVVGPTAICTWGSVKE